jgi:integrase
MANRHPGSIERRGDSYRVRIYLGRQMHRFNLKPHTGNAATDRKLVEKFAREKHRELERQHERVAAGLPGGVRFSALLELFESQELPTVAPGTQRAYRKSLAPIRAYFVEQRGNPEMSAIQPKDISAFLGWRRVSRSRGRQRAERFKPTPLTNRTLQRDRAVLHRLFTIAERMQYREGNPVAHVDAPKADSRDPMVLDDDQYEKLIDACSERPMLQFYVLLLGETGMRCESEALFLRWEDVDLDDGFLWIASGRDGHRTKSGKGRWVPMVPRLAAAMKEHFAAFRFAAYHGARSPWVLHHTRDRRHYRAGERVRSFRRAFGTAATNAKLPTGFHQHDLRHRRVTTWLGEGRSAVLVKEAMGHSDLRVTMGYAHLSREHLKALVQPRLEPTEALRARSGAASA